MERAERWWAPSASSGRQQTHQPPRGAILASSSSIFPKPKGKEVVPGTLSRLVTVGHSAVEPCSVSCEKFMSFEHRRLAGKLSIPSPDLVAT